MSEPEIAPLTDNLYTLRVDWVVEYLRRRIGLMPGRATIIMDLRAEGPVPGRKNRSLREDLDVVNDALDRWRGMDKTD